MIQKAYGKDALLKSQVFRWVFEYDQETKRQSSEWHTAESPRPTKAQMRKSKMKSILVLFSLKVLSMRSSYHPEIVNTAFYMEVLKRPNKRVARICPKIANT
jgi:hypothetical protein